ncbi:MAG: SDR family oxidoreductase [Galactobacter sp.]
MTIAITGANGQLGRLVLAELKQRTDQQVVALVRDPAKTADLAEKGIEVRAFDYDQPDALTPALEGVDRLLLISGSAIGQRIPQHQAVIEAAKAAGVGFLAYTSLLHVDTATISLVAPEHQATEALLAESGLPVALLRNNWYTENFAGTVESALAIGVILSSAGEGRVNPATRQDLAEAAAVILAAEAPEAGVYELSGDESWTYADLAAALTEKTGTPVAVQDLTKEAHAEALAGAGVPEGFVDFLLNTDAAIAAGEYGDPNPGTLSKLIGHPTATLKDSLPLLGV